MSDAAPPDVADAADRIRELVDERRRRGEYPPGLEADLDAHFRRISEHRMVPDLSELHERLEVLQSLPPLSPERISTASEARVGSALHGAVARVVHRQVQGTLEQVQELSAAVRSLLEALVDVVERPAHVHADLVGQLDALEERLALLEVRQPTLPLSTEDASSHAGSPSGPSHVFRAGSNVAALAEHENGSLGAVEIDDLDRLSADDVLELVALSSAKLREGGHLVVEYRGRPRLIHPGYLGSVLSQAGFSSVVVEWMPDGADFAVIATR